MFFIKNKLAFIILILASFLRLYQLPEHAMFLGDQGRDAIIIKRILYLEHFPAIGAPTSIGQVYLGPFYYYFVAPFLLLFAFNPVGLAYGVAFLSIIAALAAFFIIKKNLDKTAAIIFLLLLGFSFVNIELSRFSWNPNLLPAFSFFTIFFFYKTLKEKGLIFPLVFGALFSFSFQLHYLAALLAPVFLIFTIAQYRKNTTLPLKLIVSILAFFFFSIPLLLFDLRHNFLNSKNFLKLFQQQNVVSSNNYLLRLSDTGRNFIEHFLAISVSQTLAAFILILVFILGVGLAQKKKNFFFSLFFVVFYTFILSFSLLDSPRHTHYFAPASYSFFVIIAYLFSQFFKNKLLFTKLVILFCLSIYLFFNLKKTSIFLQPGNKQILHAQRVANSIYKQVKKTPYQLVAIPQNETETEYRYFLELKDKKPLPDNTPQQPQELFVICKQKPCNVLGHPQWQIASFTAAKIAKIWDIDNLRVYKLIHK